MSYNKDMLVLLPQFKAAAFVSDYNKGINCQCLAINAYHLLECKLFINSGDHLDDRIALSSTCPLLSKETVLSVGKLRERAGITDVALPIRFSQGKIYDQLSNQIKADSGRISNWPTNNRGAQKALHWPRQVIY